MNLDVKTLFMVITLGYFTGALILAVLAITVRSISRTIRAGWGLWAVCLLFSGLGALLIGQRGTIPDILSIIVANAFLTIGFGLRPNAIALLNNKAMRYLYLPVVGTIGWLGLYSFEFFREDTMLRVFYVNGFCLIGILLCLWESWQLDHKQVSSWLLTGAFALDAIVRVSLIAAHLQRQFPTLLESYETLPLQLCILILIATIVVKVVGISVSIFEMQRKKYQDEAEKDPLTGLYNQRGFYRATDTAISRLGSEAAPYSLILMEIDDLKSMEKRFGVSMMDALLKLFAKISRANIPGEVVAGIDQNGQIALFLPLTNNIGAVSYARRISKALTTESTSASGAQFSTTMSAGVFSGNTETSVKRALEFAEHCLRQAKKNGGNGILVNDGSNGLKAQAVQTETPFARRSKKPDFTRA